MTARWSLAIVVLLAGCARHTTSSAGPSSSSTPPTPCGMSPDDWCPAPPGDPCGRYKSVADCRADPLCIGLPYRGESVAPCRFDARGFPVNCPTVGCISRQSGK